METVTLSTELTTVLQTEAESTGKTMTAVAEEWLRQHYVALRRERLATQTQRFWANHARLYAEYPNQVVAFYNDEVLDYDSDMRRLALRVRETHGNLPVVIAQVTQPPVRSYKIRSPRLQQEQP